MDARQRVRLYLIRDKYLGDAVELDQRLVTVRSFHSCLSLNRLSSTDS